MLNLLYADLFKLRKTITMKVLLIVMSLSAIGFAAFSHFIANGTIDKSSAGNISALSEVMMMSLLTAIMLGTIVCTDFETKSIHDSVACGNGRFSIVVSKAITFTIVSIILILPYALTVIVCYCTNISFEGGLVLSTTLNIISEVNDSISISEIVKIIAIFLVQAVMFAARMSIVLPLTFKIKKSFIITAVGFGISGVIDLLINTISDVDIVKKIISFTPYNSKNLVLSLGTSAGSLLKIFVASVIFITIMVFISYNVFKKSEIK